MISLRSQLYYSWIKEGEGRLRVSDAGRVSLPLTYSFAYFMSQKISKRQALLGLGFLRKTTGWRPGVFSSPSASELRSQRLIKNCAVPAAYREPKALSRRGPRWSVRRERSFTAALKTLPADSRVRDGEEVFISKNKETVHFLPSLEGKKERVKNLCLTVEDSAATCSPTD